MSTQDPMPPAEQLETMYATLLDAMLTPPNTKDLLIKTQSLEKKWQLCQLHNNMIDDGATAGVFGRKEEELLNTIRAATTPDMQKILELKTMVKTGNKQWMEAFLKFKGIDILVEKMETRVMKVPMSELDASLLFELLLCCKAVMNNETGMVGMLEANRAIDVIARSVCFEWKPLALQVCPFCVCKLLVCHTFLFILGA